MRSILRHMLIVLIAVFLTGSLAIPHICLDDDAALVKVEQQVKVAKTATDSHQDGSKAGDHCCVAHHCCFAKVLNPAHQVSTIAFSTKADLFAVTNDHFSSFDPKGLDRPPKFFA